MKRSPSSYYTKGYQRPRRKRSRSKVITILLIVVIALAVCVLGLSAYKLLGIARSHQEASDTYARVESIFTGDQDGDNTILSDGTGIQWDYDKLLDMCSDAVGYIYQKDVMSYPIVQAEDNEKYLRTMINGEYNVAGTIFVDARCEEGMEGKYSIVYGHNMYSTGMFSSLPDYKDESYYKEHPYFDIYIGYKHYRYYVFSAFVAEAEGYVYTYTFEEGQYKAQFDRLRSECPYDTDVRELREDDHVIVLSTCVPERDYDYRNVVCLVRGEEVVEVQE